MVTKRISIIVVLALAMSLAAASADIQDNCAVCPEMISLPAGQFLMGTAPEDRLIDPRTGKPATNDGPQHEVVLRSGFDIGKYEVTVEQYAAFVNATGREKADGCMGFTQANKFAPSKDFDWNRIETPQSRSHPVVCVSWFDAAAYAKWLSEKTGDNYRLPSEAEWEYAARAGTTTPYHWGVDAADACEYANVRSPGAKSISKRQADSDVTDGFPCDDGYPHAVPVGQFRPNDFGLYDMQGNAWEWVADCNHKDYTGAPTDGSAWLDAEGCQFGLIRSGSFLNRVERSSTTVRVGRPRSGRATNMGFRVARDPQGDQASPAGQAAAWILDTSADESPGGQLFAENCLACHQRKENFRGIYGRDFASIENTIRTGGNNIMSMPAFGDVLSQEEIDLLATYVRDANGWND